MKRDQFLSRVTSALRGAEIPAVGGQAAGPEIRFADPADQFVRAAGAVDARVLRVADEIAAIAAVEEAMSLRDRPAETRGRSGGRFIAWDEVDWLAPGLFERLAGTGWQRIDATVGADTRATDLRRIGDATVGITGVDIGVAATGSLVLCHGPGRPRSASLLVESHIAIVSVEAIVDSLSDAFERVQWGHNSNIVAITGPSRTGDIESILTIGVHGPRHLTIVVVG